MIVLRVRRDVARAEAQDVIGQLRLLAVRFPGDHTLELRIGDRALTLGPEWRFDASAACLAALGEFGTVEAPEPS